MNWKKGHRALVDGYPVLLTSNPRWISGGYVVDVIAETPILNGAVGFRWTAVVSNLQPILSEVA